VRAGSFIRTHVEDICGLTQGGGYLEERIAIHSKRAEFICEPRRGMLKGWIRLA
jgi:hypothetical protein